MKKTLLTLLIVVCSFALSAQEFKLSRNSGTLDLQEINQVTVVGYDGNEIIFTSSDHDTEVDERAKGLRAINGSGLHDNTGLGLAVAENGNVVEVRQMRRTDGPTIKIRVPRNMEVRYTHTSPYGDDFVLSNLAGGTEISTVHNSVKLENVTGTVAVKSVHGDVDIICNTSPQNPINGTSVNGAVDLAVPLASKINIRLASQFGEMLVDPGFKIELSQQNSVARYNDKIDGKINGGGTDVKISSTHSNVYLRKK